MHRTDVITPEQANNLTEAFRVRVRRTPDAVAYVQYDEDSERWQSFSWAETEREILRWREALGKDGLNPGDRVAIMLRNCREWVIFDQAALGLGLVTVPIYTNDRPRNIGYILADAGVRIFLLEDDEQWQRLGEIHDQLAGLTRVISLKPVETAGPASIVTHAAAWLPDTPTRSEGPEIDPDGLASIVYTSGTTGKPKGVMLSHNNFLWNVWASLKSVPFYPDDQMLSFLPLSHALERTGGYYLPVIAGSSVAFARSVAQLADDLLTIKPTVLISVPRIFERVYSKIQEKLKAGPAISRKLFESAVNIGYRRFEFRQGRARWSPSLLAWPILEKLVARKIQARLGGRVRFAVSGGAPLSAEIARLFIGLGINIQQGYGLTETSPVITANPMEDNLPASVGIPVEGVEIRVGENDELLTRSRCVMMGYWNQPEATREAIEPDGWLHTGDQVRIENGHVFITGRLKDIIVLANGEKVPPSDMEMAIALDAIFDQVMVLGEGRPYLTALVVLNNDELSSLAVTLGLDSNSDELTSDDRINQEILKRINIQLDGFPGYAQIRRVGLIREPWDIDSGFMTPTMKLCRARIINRYGDLIESLYEGH